MVQTDIEQFGYFGSGNIEDIFLSLASDNELLIAASDINDLGYINLDIYELST